MQVEIPGYEIVREIGRGAMATVYLAIRKSLDRPVALKILSPTLTADPSFQERFMKEGRIIAKLTHPNIVTVHDIDQHGNAFYMDLEYAGGGSLATRPRANVSEAEAVRITVEIARALSFAHRHDFVHRDIKPANILFRDDGTALLSDFGIAKALSANTNLTGFGFTVGTPSYMSPEQASGKPVTTQSDIYSLGVTFYEMLTGFKPYIAEDSIALAVKHVNEPIPRLPANVAHYQSVIDICMAKSPLERYQNGDELIRELQIASAGSDLTMISGAGSGPTIPVSLDIGRSEAQRPEEISHSPAETTGSVVPRRMRTRWFVLVTLVLGIVAASGYWQWQRQTRDEAIAPFDPAGLGIEVVLPEVRIRDQASALLEVGRSYVSLAQSSPLQDDSRALSEDVAGQLAELIALADAAGKKDLARTLMDEALTIAPRSRALADLRDKLSEASAQRTLSSGEQSEVDRLLADADSHERAGRFTLPGGANALDTYRRVLTIEPGNSTATAKLKALADIFLHQAELELRQQAFRDAGASIEAGLMFDPNHEGLRELSTRFQSPAVP